VVEPIEVLAELFGSAGGQAYLGEAVSLATHMFQAGMLAERDGAPDCLVAAALLHDVGHIVGQRSQDLDMQHEVSGAEWLSQWFPEAVTEPVRLHVAAKRYLCATEPAYAARLSAASQLSLVLQGGPMSAEEVQRFESMPHASEAVKVRRWDEAAKDAGAETPGFEHFRVLLMRSLRD
jgi:gamma-butyrobetaine dioxygenase